MTTKVIVPYIKLHPVTKFVLQNIVDRDRISVGFVDINHDPTEGYFDLLAEMWQKKEQFIVVEPDILPWPGALEEIANCGYDLCNFFAPCGRTSTGYALGYGLGCTKFSEYLMINFPKFFEELAVTLGGKHWTHIDGKVLEGLRERSVVMHFHRPPVIHLNESRWPVSV